MRYKNPVKSKRINLIASEGSRTREEAERISRDRAILFFFFVISLFFFSNEGEPCVAHTVSSSTRPKYLKRKTGREG